MKIVISAESTIDLPQEMLDKFDIHTTPFTINFNDKLVEDHFGVSKEIFEFVDKTKKLPKTSAVSPDQFQTHFENLKKDYDAIIHVSLSSLISSAYNNACLVAKDMENVFVVDSKSLSTGIALLAIRGKELVDQGKQPSEIYQTLTGLASNVQAGFVLEKLNYLYKGGRCSALALLGANILKIKPQIILSNGRMVVGKKYMGGMSKVVGKYLDDLLVENPNPVLENVFITHSSPMPEAEEILTAKLKERGFKNIYNTLAGGTISSHCGPNCIGVLFLNN